MSEQNKNNYLKFSKKVFYKIRVSLVYNGNEEGGILGINNNNVIDHFVKDSPQKLYSHKYEPNFIFLNQVIQEWKDNEIEFCGMIHTHPLGYPKLSYGDICYAKQILKLNQDMRHLYFGVTQENKEGFKIHLYVFIKDQNSDEITYADISDTLDYSG